MPNFFSGGGQLNGKTRLFCDLGSNVGQSVMAFLKWKRESALEYDVFCFEPNIEFIPAWMSNIFPIQSHLGSVNLIPSIVGSNNNDYMEEFDGWQLAEFGGVRSRDRLVPIFDFASWLMSIKNRYSEIIVKMDIEGAEYKLISDMHYSGSLRYIDSIFMEIHGHKRGFSRGDTDKMINMIYRNGVTPFLWEADLDGTLLYDPNLLLAQIIPSNYIITNSKTKKENFNSLHDIMLIKR